MADRLTAIEIFVRAMRLGGLSAAAREMRMSPAMAGKHLTSLEARLGVTLAHRTTRRLLLTEAGEAYLATAERLLAELSEAEAEASAQAEIIGGLLRVSAPAAFGVLHLIGLVTEFNVLYPAVTVEMDLSDGCVDVLDQRSNMAISIGPQTDGGLLFRKLADARLSICASPFYLNARGTPKELGDLEKHDCLGCTLSSFAAPSYWRFGCEGEIKVPIRGPVRADNAAVLVQAAIAGLGLVYSPRVFTAAAIADGRLVEVTLDAPLLQIDGIHAVTHSTRNPAAKTRAWINFLADRFRSIASDW